VPGEGSGEEEESGGMPFSMAKEDVLFDENVVDLFKTDTRSNVGLLPRPSAM